MSQDKVYVGNARVRILLNTGSAIDDVPTLEMVAWRPDKSSVVWTATLSGTSGLYFDTLPDSLDQAGEWRFQARLRWSPTEKLDGAAVPLMVYAPPA